MVEVTVNGKLIVTSVKIEQDIVDPNDVETLEILIQSAFNDASAKVQERLQSEGLKAASTFAKA